jgi:multidrug efflux system membrane fusion protein
MSLKAFVTARQSPLTAAAIALGILAWLTLGPREPPAGEGAEAVPARERLTRVRVRQLESRRITQELVISGRAEPARAVTLRAEVDGRIVELGAQRGTQVHAGDLIARIDMRDRLARRKQALAAVEQRRIEFDAATELEKRNLQSETLLAQSRANLTSAEALVEQIEIEIANTTVNAPFAGVLDRRPVEIGTFAKSGDELARIIEQDPMLVVGSVTQLDRHLLVLGDPGVARLITGQVVTGLIRYIGSEADEATRTFRVELEVPNPDGAVVAGTTAEISIPVRSVIAHQVSPALLSQDRLDAVGIKAVALDDTVTFHPVEVIRSSADGLWVSGLPQDARVITVGHGFVRVGEEVRAVPEESIADTPETTPPQ